MKRFYCDIKKYWNYVIYAAKSELKSEVANSYLNWLWWIIEPLAFMAIYALVFGVFFGAREPHFTAFIFVGITMWDFFNRMLRSNVEVVKYNKSVVSKVYIPKHMLVITKAMVNGFKLCIGFTIVFLLIIVDKIQLTVQVLWLIPILIVLFLFTFGVSCFVLHFGVYVNDLPNVLNIVLRLLMYLTGIFYSIENRLSKHVLLKNILVRGNPIAMLISGMRNCLLYGQAPHYKWLGIWFILSLLICYAGIKKIYKNENSYVKVI